MSVCCVMQTRDNEAQVPNVPRAREGRIRGSLCVPGARNWQDVRVQEDGEETHKEETRRIDGTQREARPLQDSFPIYRMLLGFLLIFFIVLFFSFLLPLPCIPTLPFIPFIGIHMLSRTTGFESTIFHKFCRA